MAAEKNVIAYLDESAIESVKWAEPKSVNKFFAGLGATKGAAGVWAMMAHGLYHVGFTAAGSGENTPKPTPDAPIDAFATARKNTPGTQGYGKDLSKKTLETYVSVGKSLIDIGYLPYDATSVMDFVARDLGKVPFSTRGRIIKSVLDQFPTTEPSAEELAKLAPSKSENNLTDALDAIAKSLAALVTNEKFVDDFDGDDVLAAYKEASNALAELVNTSNAIVPRTPATTRGKTLSAKAQALKERLAA